MKLHIITLKNYLLELFSHVLSHAFHTIRSGSAQLKKMLRNQDDQMQAFQSFYRIILGNITYIMKREAIDLKALETN